MIADDSYVFHTLSICTRLKFDEHFYYLPRNIELENTIINLGKVEASLSAKISMADMPKVRLNNIWTHLNLTYDYSNLVEFKIPQILIAGGVIGFPCNPKPLTLISMDGKFRTTFSRTERVILFKDNNDDDIAGVLFKIVKEKVMVNNLEVERSSKIIIPFVFARYQNFMSHLYSFWPDNYAPLFFNNHFLSKANIVILTENLLLAKNNQQCLRSSCINDIAWISWYGELTKYPWQYLRGKTIYYYISYRTPEAKAEQFKLANDIHSQLQAVGLKLRFIFQNYNSIATSLSDYSVPPTIQPGEMFLKKGIIEIIDFNAKITQRQRRRTFPLIRPYFKTGERIIIYGEREGKQLWLLSQLYRFCNKVDDNPIKGVAIYIHSDDSNVSNHISELGYHGLSYTYIYPASVQEAKIYDIPTLVDLSLNISNLDTNSDLDISSTIELIYNAVKNTQYNLGNKFNKIVILDSIFSILKGNIGHCKQLFNELEQQGVTVVIVENNAANLRKILSANLEIKVTQYSSPHGQEISCDVSNGDKLQFLLNLYDYSNLLKRSPFKRKAKGLSKSRKQLASDIDKLMKKGNTGKAIAAELSISESMVKKLKGEFGLSKKRTKSTIECFFPTPDKS